MPLLIRPVKMNKSIYVRVPNDIAHLIGLDNQVEVSFSFEDHANQLRLIYSLSKPNSDTANNPAEARKLSVDPSAVQGLQRRNGREEHGTETETQEVPEG